MVDNSRARRFRFPALVLNTSLPATSARMSTHGTPLSAAFADEDFEPDLSDSDDEETIDREESASRLQPEEQSRELELLQREGELPLDQLLDSLPPEILEGPAPRRRPSHSSQDDGEASSDRSGSPIDVSLVLCGREAFRLWRQTCSWHD